MASKTIKQLPEGLHQLMRDLYWQELSKRRKELRAHKSDN